jgi:hypothetical protein
MSLCYYSGVTAHACYYAQWGKMSEEDKKPYVAQAAEDVKRYQVMLVYPMISITSSMCRIMR